MYRYSQTLPGGPITLVGIFALSFLVPGWVANALGFSALNALVASWIFAHQGIFFVALLLLYAQDEDAAEHGPARCGLSWRPTRSISCAHSNWCSTSRK